MKRTTVERISAIWSLLGGEEGVDQILSGKKVVRIEDSYVSRDSQQVQLPGCRINTEKFYSQQGWLDVYPDIRALMDTGLLCAEVEVVDTTFLYLDLNGPKTGRQILDHISSESVFEDPVSFFAYLSIMISAQRMFPDGEALADFGLVSIFFVRHNGIVHVVGAYVQDSGELDELTGEEFAWYCTVYDLDYQFGDRDRVFYPA